MLYSVRMISANMVSVIVKFLLFKEGYLVEMPTLLMFLSLCFWIIFTVQHVYMDYMSPRGVLALVYYDVH